MSQLREKFYRVQENRIGLEFNGKHQPLGYADDVNMLGENLQNTEIFIKASKDIGLNLNSERAKHMITSSEQNIVQNQNFIIRNLSFEIAERLKYLGSTAVEQVVALAPVTQRARVRSSVGTSFLGEVCFGVFPYL